VAINKRKPEELEEERLKQEQELARQRALEQEKERIRALAERRGQNERSVMDSLVEGDTQPRALEELSRLALDVNEWYLRYMVVEKLGRQILLDQEYAQEDLQKWLAPFALRDANSYVRRAAIKWLTDLEALGEASSKDAETIVRKKAVERLFDFLDFPAALDALGEVALRDKEPELRHMAVLKIVDQAVLAKVSREDTEPAIRQSATQKLTGQDDIAWVLLNDTTVLVRSTAAQRMTNVSALVQAAERVVQPAAPEAALEALDQALVG
jgi:hypothetical protein